MASEHLYNLVLIGRGMLVNLIEEEATLVVNISTFI